VGLDQPGPLGLIHRQQNETSHNHPNRATAAALQIKKCSAERPIAGIKTSDPSGPLATRVSIFFIKNSIFAPR
jgi:hypothetical protein